MNPEGRRGPGPLGQRKKKNWAHCPKKKKKKQNFFFVWLYFFLPRVAPSSSKNLDPLLISLTQLAITQLKNLTKLKKIPSPSGLRVLDGYLLLLNLES